MLCSLIDMSTLIFQTMSKKGPKRVKKFNSNWLEEDDFQSWLKSVPGDETKLCGGLLVYPTILAWIPLCTMAYSFPQISSWFPPCFAREHQCNCSAEAGKAGK